MPQRHPSVTYTSPTYIPQTVCPRCGANTRLIWRSPLPADLKGEMRAFECKDCGKQTKIVVEE
jgi:predicted RNA-binding Zn-ribbon protein involved in translation (DUF1610 family)